MLRRTNSRKLPPSDGFSENHPVCKASSDHDALKATLKFGLSPLAA